MYAPALVALGAILLAYALVLCRKMIPLIKWPYLKKPWRGMFLLLYFFLIGYVLYAYVLISSVVKYALDDSVVGALLLLGAIFIAAILRACYILVDGLSTTEIEVLSSKRALEYDQGALEKDKKDIETKREELEKALEELYLLRNAMERGKAKIGSKKIKKLLDDLKDKTDKIKKNK